MSTDAPPQYTIRLYDRYEMVCEFQVSQYRYGRRELYELMRAIFVRGSSIVQKGLRRSMLISARETRLGTPDWT